MPKTNVLSERERLEHIEKVLAPRPDPYAQARLEGAHAVIKFVRDLDKDVKERLDLTARELAIYKPTEPSIVVDREVLTMEEYDLVTRALAYDPEPPPIPAEDSVAYAVFCAGFAHPNHEVGEEVRVRQWYALPKRAKDLFRARAKAAIEAAQKAEKTPFAFVVTSEKA